MSTTRRAATEPEEEDENKREVFWANEI